MAAGGLCRKCCGSSTKKELARWPAQFLDCRAKVLVKTMSKLRWPSNIFNTTRFQAIFLVTFMSRPLSVVVKELVVDVPSSYTHEVVAVVEGGVSYELWAPIVVLLAVQGAPRSSIATGVQHWSLNRTNLVVK